MKAEEAISYIENYGWSTTRLGLGRTKELLAALGDPQKKLKFIHVAGSNGKGSACAMFDAVLRQAGYKCGLYTSPYIEDFCERIQINGQNIPGEVLADITEKVMILAEQMEDHPSQFELVTAIAMEYYCRENCDIVVLEVGMGGALDSTNAIDAPELACITNIGLEHTEYLGDTLEEIARTKAGIIKPGCSCVCYDGAPEVTNVIREVCGSLQVPLACVDYSRLRFLSGSLDGQRFSWRQKDGTESIYDLALIGNHQLHNAALVLTGLELLREKGWKISEDAVKKGLLTVKWPARLEVLNRAPLVLLDGGHNPQCAQALVESLDSLLPGQKVVFLAGVLKDKDYGNITDLMIPYAKEFVCVTPLSDRALTGKDFAAYLKGRGVDASACDSIEQGIVTALEKTGHGTSFSNADETAGVVIFGSLYLAGAARKVFRKAYKKWIRKTKIKMRDSLSAEERKRRSEQIAERIIQSELFKQAQTIMIYEAVKGEVSLEALKAPAAKQGKTLVYPRCTDQETMKAFKPLGPDSFEAGPYGIPEPVPERSEEIDPKDIDLVICPCTAFDNYCNRLGMGAGYYDRFLAQCVNAKITAAAFEAQRTDLLPKEPWDMPMRMVFTENAVRVPSCV